MNFHKLIINNKFLRYSSFWWWVRLIAHEGFRFDDYHIWGEFWSSLNGGWLDMNYKWEYEKFWGKNVEPERIILSEKAFDELVERLNQPQDPAVVERIKELMSKPAPWDDDYEQR